MHHLTPTQKRILQLLPATPNQLAQALYGRATESERKLVYVHIALLRRRLSACSAQAGLTRPERRPDGSTGSPRRLVEGPGRRDGVARITSRSMSAGRQAAHIMHGRQPDEDNYICRIIYDLEP